MGVLRDHTNTIKQISQRLGFDYCGVARAQKLDDDARRLEAWLSQGMHGNMQYMENNFDLRIDPAKLVPGARSVITVMQNYFPSARQDKNAPGISKYAYGRDYHEVIRAKMKEFLHLIREEIGEVNGRGFVDSAPVLERSWAQRTGIGWIGKNGNLINPQSGSFFFIATLITDLEMAYDDPFARDMCGTCTRCIDACPTNAIMPGKVVNGSQCISYFTIELKESNLPAHLQENFSGWAFGCDICQDICPWNRFSKPHQEAGFQPLPEVLNLSSSEWEEMTEESFKKIFKHSPISRTKWKGMQRNVRFINHPATGK